MSDLDHVYGGNHSPSRAWLEATTQNRDLEYWLTRNLVPLLRAHVENDTPLSVLDAGCGWGEMSFRLHYRLRCLGLGNVQYHAADPVRDQLATFVQRAEKQQLTGITTHEDGIMQLEPPQEGRYNLVFTSHTLYHVENMELALRRLLSLGERVIIVHRGRRGIQTIQERFADYVGAGPHMISTADHVHNHLQRIMLDDSRTLQSYGFVSTVEVAACTDPTSVHGNNLIAFFLQRRLEDIPLAIVEQVRAFICEAYKTSGYKMNHDVGVFVIN